MTNTLDPLILDLVEWAMREPRTYTDVMDAWRTSCPRLTVWEDAVERGFLVRQPSADGQVMVVATEEGRAWLQAHGRSPAPAPATVPVD